MIIDANSYWFDERIFHDETLCEQFLAEVPRAYDTEGYLTVNSVGKRQIVIEMPAGSPGLNYIEGDYTLEKRLADMDEAGSTRRSSSSPAATSGCRSRCVGASTTVWPLTRRRQMAA